MTVLFADICGFDSMMAVLKPEEIMGFLDEFYSTMGKIVSNNEGSIGNSIGEGVLAFFGSPISSKNSSENGVKTAIEMLLSFQALKEKLSTDPSYSENLGIGIGLDTGVVFSGNVSAKGRSNYTIAGDTVHLVRTLCCYAQPDQILTTERTLNEIPGMVSSEFVEKIFLKGICEPVNTYRITASSSSSLTRAMSIYCRRAA
jgi:class 3 adenylate cyclase